MILYDLNKNAELPEGEVHMAIGMFDGVHLGHQKLIDAAIDGAQKCEGISVAVTFWPHPTTFLRRESPVPTIMPPEIKNHFLEEKGIDIVVQKKFTEDFTKTSAKEFVRLLKQSFPELKAIYTGGDFRFGHNREGDLNFLKNEGNHFGFAVIAQSSVLYKGEVISSTRIREALRVGNIEDANEMLGHPYFSTGLVIEKTSPQGQYPTLDIVWRPELKPRYGVYAIKARSGKKGTELKGIANYGVAPTVKNDADPMLQVYLFEEPPEWGPGDLLTIEWLHFIRPEQKFESRDALDEQIRKDIEEAKNTLKYLF